MKRNHVVFLINLLQDVNIVRPLVYIAARDLGLRTVFLITPQFFARDTSAVWQTELEQIAVATGTPLIMVENLMMVSRLLDDKAGLLVAASESNLSAHTPVHDIFRIAPSSFVRITLQHGYECVGFLQSRDHDIAHGTQVRFAADIVCGWTDTSILRSMLPSQRKKLYVAGPPLVLQGSPAEDDAGEMSGTGLVCENMHSVRLNIAGDFRTEFMQVFEEFAAALARDSLKVSLRPHPGGQYVLKNQVELPANVLLNNEPIYKVNLSAHAYGISAPSSVLIDMVLAGIPVAVWRDRAGVMDTDNYSGLTEVHSLQEWIDFARAARTNPQPFLELQQRFIERLRMPREPALVYRNYAALLASANRLQPPVLTVPEPQTRVMFIANALIPTLQLSFIEPLRRLVEQGSMTSSIVTEEEYNRLFGRDSRHTIVHAWLAGKLATFRPDLLVFCRYSGPHTKHLLKLARQAGIRVIYHIDDDLLNVPEDLGDDKFSRHNELARVATVRYLLDNADLIYASTRPLLERLRGYGIIAPLLAGSIYCAGSILAEPAQHVKLKIGYMGFGHGRDLELVLPAIIRYLERNPQVEFELFGTIPKPQELKRFGKRIKVLPPVRDYAEFLQTLSGLGWSVGICPLINNDFNSVKADTKWVEYTSAGIAVVASRGLIYDDCCSDDCGILAGNEDEWLAALEALTVDETRRLQLVRNAQNRLQERYSPARLTDQVRQMFAQSAERQVPHERILIVANAFVPTLQLSFLKPLDLLVRTGELSVDLLTHDDVKQHIQSGVSNEVLRALFADKLQSYRPTMLVFCRYNALFSDYMIEWARREGIPTVYHIDDDLLTVPVDLGDQKHKIHNHPRRLATVRYLLKNVDLIYSSTNRLRERLYELGIDNTIIAGDIYCSGEVLAPAPRTEPVRIGYMASADHTHNLKLVLPAIVTFMQRNPEARFEFFGSIPVPPELAGFGDRVTVLPPVKNYASFLEEFARCGWAIGICPLAPIPFNLMKANTKWVEYTSAGIAVIASRGTVYDECCADGCGILAGSTEEWLAALERLYHDSEYRFQQVRLAQEKLVGQYSLVRLREQVIDVLRQARHQAQINSGECN